MKSTLLSGHLLRQAKIYRCLPHSSSALTLLFLFFFHVASVQAVTDTFSTAGTSTWTAPAGVTSVMVEAWGGGGAGGGATGNPAKGGGGAGGQYASSIVTVSSGSNYTIVVGAGGTGNTGNGNNGGNSTFATTTVVARGGVGGTRATSSSSATGGVGSTASGVGTTVYAGGNGSDGVGSTGAGGAGGGGAGNNGTGGNATGNTAGTGTANGGGNGGTGLTSMAAGNSGSVAGGGGGGGYATNNTDRNGGNGASGKVTITYVIPPTITSLSPVSKNVGDAAFTLTVNGSNFINGSQVQFNGASRPTTFVSASQLRVSIPASDLSSATVHSVTVVNGSTTSNAVAFSVIPPLPTLPSQCFTDTFDSLNVNDWNVSETGGNSSPIFIPNVVGGRLRLTDKVTNRASMAQLQRWLPAADNTVVLTFDYYAYGGSGADGMGIVLSDTSTTPTPGASGGSLGYAQKTGVAGFNGGWLGIGLDEWGNFPCTNEGRTGYPANWVPPVGANTAACTGANGGGNAIAVRGRGNGSANTEYKLLARTSTLSPILWSNTPTMTTPHKYRITFDHSNSSNAWLTVQRDTTGTGNSYISVVPTFDVKALYSGQTNVPENFYLSLTASTGGSTNFHEIDNVTLCATTLLPVGGGVHHLEITGNATGPTCQPTTLTIKACADAVCTGYTSTAVSGTLTANKTVTWGAGAPVFTIPAGSISTTVNVTVPSGATTFDINPATVTPAAINRTSCNLGGLNTCTFTGTASGLSLTVPNHISCNNQAVTLKGCGSTFANTGRTITLSTAYMNPTSGTQQATATYLTNSGTTASVVLASTPTTLSNVKFDATATAADLKISYPDVGQLQLNASYTGSSATGDAGVSMTGSTSFIAAPASFTISPITAAPLIAGKNFAATVTAKNNCATPTTTPNFGREIAPENVTISHIRNQPTGAGASNGIFTSGLGGFTNGVATSNNLNWSEVGKIDLNAVLASGNYLGSNVTAATGSISAVGAFIPDHFDTTVIQGCNADVFTYSGQAFPVKVTALNGLAIPTTTVNYDGTANTSPNFAKAVTLSDANGIAGSLSPNSVAASAFSAGVATASPSFTFTTKETAPATIKLRAVDTNNVSSATGTEGMAFIRSGRVQLTNAYGSELLNLAMPAAAQYYNGNTWITNIDDKCTNITLSFAPVGTDITGKTCVLEPANNSGQGCPSPVTGNYQFLEEGITGTDSNGVAGFAGNFNLWLKATGLGNAGALDVTADVADYLKFNWRGLGNANPTARASFGLYRGDNKVIYSRELY